jgi:hypothetical protein
VGTKGCGLPTRKTKYSMGGMCVRWRIRVQKKEWPGAAHHPAPKQEVLVEPHIALRQVEEFSLIFSAAKKTLCTTETPPG